MSEFRRSRHAIRDPKLNFNSKKKIKKSESHSLPPDSVIISSLECLRSSSSQTLTLDFDAASVSELDRFLFMKKDQSQSDDDDDDDEVIVTSYGGAVVGRLIISENDDDENGYQIDCSKIGANGKIIPPNPYSFGYLKSDALFILLVEDGDVFMLLVNDQFYNRFPCIIIRAQGQQHRATRAFMIRLRIEFKLPVFTLLDSDPYGLQILSFYKYMEGSLDVKWLGMRPSDLDNYQIPKRFRFPMTDQDVKVGKDLLKKDFVSRNKEWLMELEMMMNTRQKAEILALSSFGCHYLTEVYLPLKLHQQDWL